MSAPISFTGARWALPTDPDVPEARTGPGRAVHPAVAALLARRGFDADAGWLAPSADHLHDPFAMRGMGEAVARLRHAGDRGQRVRIVTDYDVDGTTSSLVLQAALSRAAPDLRLDYHIPDRFTEGYGFSPLAAGKAADDGVDLIVTADIGVRDHAAIEAARARGVDVLVCDHHLPAGEAVPGGATVLCPPQADCAYPNPHLAACGVSLKLADALLTDDPMREAVLGSLCKLVALGTVADLVSLATLENRALVHLGLEALNGGRHAPGLAALLEVADLRPGQIDEQDLGWRLGPRINAAGRVARATHVVELLTCRDPGRARALARELDALNRERRTLQDRLVKRALAQVGTDPDPFVVVAGTEEEGFHRGVVGIVAARIKDEVHRPAAVVSILGEHATGSVRTVPGVHAVRALDTCADLLVKYGGHPRAAGFTVRAEHLPTLRQRLSDHVEGLDADLVEEHAVDAVLPATDVDEILLAQLRRMAPFGQGNPEPQLLLPGVRIDRLRPLGKDGKHLRFSVDGLDTVWWRGAAHADGLQAGQVDLLGTVGIDTFRGRRTLRFTVTDARAAG